MKKSKEYIQHKNHFNLWFKERVSTAEKNNTYKDDSEDFYDSDNGTEVMIDKVVDFAALASGNPAGNIAAPVIKMAVKKARGTFERLQNKHDDKTFNQLPCGDEKEALLHLDVCLEYMEIVDKALVDEIPKIFIMMLGHKLLDYLRGGESYGTSLLRNVQKKIKTDMTMEDVMAKSFEHGEMMKDLKNRKSVAENTIYVLNQTKEALSGFK